ncbi:MAG: CocE/NonD family hydrolase [Spirochaetes bacterium]|nr:CocE/NonD family hydrolase [Spirochaetota bacterium]
MTPPASLPQPSRQLPSGAALLFLLLPLFAPGQTPWATERLDVSIPTRDGKSLQADLYLPAKAGRYPAVLIQTPYNKKSMGAPFATGNGEGPEAGRGAISDALAILDRDHYVYAIVDNRGFYKSKPAAEGVKRGTVKQGWDGFDCVEWVAAQSWCDGKVGTWGGSALGRIQFETAKERPPHLVCCVPLIAPLDQGYGQYFEEGILLEGRLQTLDKLGFDLGALVRGHRSPESPLWKIWNRATDRPDLIEVPCLLITGWWDELPGEILRSFESIVARGGERARGHSRLLIGPWDHISIGLAKQGDLAFEAAQRASATVAKAFLDYWLRGVQNGWEQTSRVRYWQLGEEKWLEAPSWDGLKRIPVNLPLDPSPKSYVCDPRHPAPTLGGANLPPLPHGPTVQSALDSRTDGLSIPVEVGHALRVNGNPTLRFRFTADRPSCDLIARLCWVRGGKPYLLSESGKRFAPIRPGEILQAVLAFPPIAVTGERFKVYLSSASSPRYERNPNTGADHWDEAAAGAVTVTVIGGMELSLPTLAETPVK